MVAAFFFIPHGKPTVQATKLLKFKAKQNWGLCDTGKYQTFEIHVLN